MAGIGFKIQQALSSKNNNFLATYGYSAIIASGPWMFAMFGLMGIASLMALNSGGTLAIKQTIDVFYTIITYIYAASIILGGVFNLGLSRFISDRLYSYEMNEILPTFLYSISLIMIAGAMTAGMLFMFSGLSLVNAFLAFLIFQSISITWFCMIYLSAAKGYVQISFAFLGSNAVGIMAAALGHYYFDLTGAFAGYAFGQAVLAAWLSFRIIREFPSSSPSSHSLLYFLMKNKYLALIGLLFNLGIWIDKFVIWNSPLGREVIGWFKCADIYDTCLYFSYLTTIPAMTIFLVQVETNFYKAYSIYFNAVMYGGDLDAIENGREKVRESFFDALSRIMRTQGLLTVMLVLAAPVLAEFFNLPTIYIPTLRWALIAAFLQAMLQFLLVFFLYFDWRKRALFMCALFAITNGLFTWISIGYGQFYIGSGYLVSLLLCVSTGFVLFARALDQLEYETFSSANAASTLKI